VSRWVPVAALLLPCAVAHAQEPLRFSGGTDLVVLHVSVTDKRGRAVSGLPREAFAVLEERRPQQISFFSSEDLPVTAGLVIDNSISMFAARDLLIAGAVAFVDASHPGDEIFALAFNEHVRSALPPEMPFTSDPVRLREALTDVITTRGRTGLYDAISAALEYTSRGVHRRKVLVLVSDGGDNASRTTLADVVARTQASNVVIYAVTIVDPASTDAKPKVMKRLAEDTGGQVFSPRSAREIDDALRRVAADIRKGYTIAYVPAVPADDVFRRLRVVVAAPGRDNLVVRTRSGYLAARARRQ
jgi:Ca-activated chloride channel family protein